LIQFDRYKYGKKHILTMSYDDGHAEDRKLVEIFNKYGIKGTFHINSGTLNEAETVNKNEIKELYAQHEVAVHTISHPHLERLPIQNVIQEVIFDRQNLEHLCGYPVRGMSFPFSTYNDDVLRAVNSCGIAYSRTTNSTKNFSFLMNFLAWNPTCHHNDELIAMGNKFLDDFNFPWRSDLFYVWGHSYEFSRDNNWILIEEFCKQMANHEQVWYATNIEIIDYINAQRNLRITVDNKTIYNPSVQTVWVSNDEETIEIKGGETLNL